MSSIGNDVKSKSDGSLNNGKFEGRPTYKGNVVSYSVSHFNGNDYPKLEIFNEYLGCGVYSLHDVPPFPFSDGDVISFYPKIEKGKLYAMVVDH